MVCGGLTVSRLMKTLSCRASLALLLPALWLGALPAHGGPLPQHDGYTHTGVATCASSNCHGKTSAQSDGNVQLNEYRLWSGTDFHSRAYQVLRNDESRAMADALGLANAQNAAICLDCHTDHVPGERRGRKFQLSDGVGCEACHGGAENWLRSHTEPDVTHQDNLDKGLYPLSDPIARADLCLSCHMGTRDKFTTHAIMAAGHPRLSFELDTFTANQPAHYQVDQDYIERKGDHPVGYLWAVGQVEMARRQLALIDTHNLGKSLAGGMIELSIYDCHSCHQGMTPRRGRPNDFSAGVPTGDLRLLDHSFDMVAVIIEKVMPGRYDDYARAVRNLHESHSKPDAIGAATDRLRGQLDELAARLRRDPPDTATIRALRREIAQNSARGRYADYSSAEQAFLALESLSYGLGDRDRVKDQLDRVFASLGDETAFEPKGFAKASGALVRVLP
jgi:hypothetical protein